MTPTTTTMASRTRTTLTVTLTAMLRIRLPMTPTRTANPAHCLHVGMGTMTIVTERPISPVTPAVLPLQTAMNPTEEETDPLRFRSAAMLLMMTAMER